VDAGQHDNPAVRRMVVMAHIAVLEVVVNNFVTLATAHRQLVAVGMIHRWTVVADSLMALLVRCRSFPHRRVGQMRLMGMDLKAVGGCIRESVNCRS
jgi:hypothetical protein